MSFVWTGVPLVQYYFIQMKSMNALNTDSDCVLLWIVFGCFRYFVLVSHSFGYRCESVVAVTAESTLACVWLGKCRYRAILCVCIDGAHDVKSAFVYISSAQFYVSHSWTFPIEILRWIPSILSVLLISELSMPTRNKCANSSECLCYIYIFSLRF